MTVVSFPAKPDKPKPRVWVCNCGCQNFWLYEDGQIECVECGTFHHSETGTWLIANLEAPVKFRVRQPDGTYVLTEKDPDAVGE